MVTITNWLYLIIPGFVYLSALFFYILILSKKYRLEINTEIRVYLPYLSILIIFSSYIIGHSFNLAFERLLFWIYPGLKNSSISPNADKNLLELINGCYANLVMFRHLFFSTIALGIALSIWLHNGKLLVIKKQFKFIVIILFVIAVFGLAYWGARELFISTQNKPSVSFY